MMHDLTSRWVIPVVEIPLVLDRGDVRDSTRERSALAFVRFIQVRECSLCSHGELQAHLEKPSIERA